VRHYKALDPRGMLKKWGFAVKKCHANPTLTFLVLIFMYAAMKKLNLLIISLLFFFSLNAFSTEFTMCRVSFVGDYKTLKEEVSFKTFILEDDFKIITLKNPATGSVMEIIIGLLKIEHPIDATHTVTTSYRVSGPSVDNGEEKIKDEIEINGNNCEGFSIPLKGAVTSLNFACSPMEPRRPGYIFRDMSFIEASWIVTSKDK
jgi:hypothetical protein